MTYPCGIIRDLLPLYIDDVCNEESKQAVENHVSECEKCRSYYESMKSTDNFAEKQNDNSEDMKMANSLKNVKSKINKKIRNIILCAVAAVLLFAIGFNVLFTMPVKNIDLKDVTVSASVYPINELSRNLDVDSDSVKISFGEADTSDAYKVEIPAMPNANISISENAIKNNEYVTVVSVSSEYFLRTTKQETKDDAIYISAFKTTLLNNKAESYQKTVNSLEFREINKIVFLEDDGTEVLLWSR